MLKHSQLRRHNVRTRNTFDEAKKIAGRGWGGSIQVAVDDVLDGHVVGSVHEMIAADNAVRLLPHVPDERVRREVARHAARGKLGGAGRRAHISKCVKKSTSSLVVNGTSAPTVPRMPLYTTASVPPV